MATPGDRFEPPPSPLRPRRRDHSGLTSDYVRQLDPPDRRVGRGRSGDRAHSKSDTLTVGELESEYIRGVLEKGGR